MNLALRRRALIAGKQSRLIENFERVGTPGIVDGVMTPSEDSWISAPQSFAPGSNTWEVVFKVKCLGTERFHNIISSAGLMLQRDNQTTKLYLMGSGSSTWNICSGTVSRGLNKNTITYVRVAFDGSTYTYGTSTDGVNFSNVTVTSSKTIASGKLSFGAKASNTNQVNAQYYLFDTYIKIGDSVWWTPYI